MPHPPAVREELDDQRSVYLAGLTVICGVLLIFLLLIGYAVKLYLSTQVAVIFLPLLLMVEVLRRSKRLDQSAWLLVGLTVLFAAVNFWEVGFTTTSAMILLVPSIVGLLVLGHNGVYAAGAATLVPIFVLAVNKSGVPDALGFTLPPTAIMVCLAIIHHIVGANTLELVYWATDILDKGTRRADTFFEQNEKLNDALLKLKIANNQLETLNVELKAAQGKAERASKAKSVFMSNMSHELRTPLNVIIGYSSSMLNMPQMFKNQAMPDVFRPYVQLIQDSGQYLVGLITDILDLSKIEAGRLELHPGPVNLADVFQGVLATCVGLLKDKPLQLRPDYPADLPIVHADAMRVRQILLNLMSNAIKFTATGSVTIEARHEGDLVRISVIDTGIGIPEEAQKVIFDRFAQAESDTDKRYGGTGLGLDISKQLSLMHGGDLTVHSEIGRGSTFTFTLPVAKEAPATEVQPFSSPESAVTLLEPLSEGLELAQAVLLVEDETETRNMARQMLEGSGYHIVDTHDGEEACTLAAGLLPDLIVLDIRLPGIDGWEVLRRLKSDDDTQSIPVLVCTAQSEADRALAMGAAGIVSKPFTAEQLVAAVKGALTPATTAPVAVAE